MTKTATVNTRKVADAVSQVAVTTSVWAWADEDGLWFKSTQDDAGGFSGEACVTYSGDPFESFLIHAKSLRAAFKGASADDEAELNFQNGRLLVTRPALTCALDEQAGQFCIRPELCPIIEPGDGHELADIPATALAYVARAASADKTRPVLCTVALGPREDGGMRLVGTDTFRLHLAEWATEQALVDKLIVPARAIRAALKRRPETVTVRWNDDRIEVSTPGGATWGQERRDEKFPNVDRVIPAHAKSGLRITMDTADLRAALLQLKPLAKRDNGRVRFDAKARTLSCRAPGYGEMTVSVDMKHTGGFGKGVNPVSCYSARYLLDALQDDPLTVIATSAALEPASIMQGAQADALTLTSVIMPMQEW